MDILLSADRFLNEVEGKDDQPPTPGKKAPAKRI
jgi:hypothetical protein